LEDLQAANMVRNRHLAKSISDVGWAQFRTILDAKAAYDTLGVESLPCHLPTPARSVAAVGSAFPRV
jgi:putative transposase